MRWRSKQYLDKQIGRRAVYPDETFLDDRNLPEFNKQQFEGVFERPVSRAGPLVLFAGLIAITVVFLGRVALFSLIQGEAYALRSEANTLTEIPVFSERGIVRDRRGKELIWNSGGRKYQEPGLAHVLGYLGYPTARETLEKDFHPEELIGRAGVERVFDETLRGVTGIRAEELDVTGHTVSNFILIEPKDGDDLSLSIDASLSAALAGFISQSAALHGFVGGAGVLIGVDTGEILALTSMPEYKPSEFSAGISEEIIDRLRTDPAKPFLNRAVSGLYAPGSIAKIFVALGALQEKVISPDKKIESTGSLVLPNPFFPDQPSIFRDWRAHGFVDLRQALAVSSNVYFYEVGGGFGNQPGLGIRNIEKYFQLFGFSEKTGIELLGEAVGTIPTPEWKAKNFDGEPWRIGDTYYTAIGQYGFQVTPLQVASAMAAVASDGRLVRPSVASIGAYEPLTKNIPIAKENFRIVKEGLRQAVVSGTARALSLPQVAVAAKTGTAEFGVTKERVHSWVTGFFPYDAPRVAFAVVMESGPRTNLVGAPAVMRQLIDWMLINTPEYLSAAD